MRADHDREDGDQEDVGQDAAGTWMTGPHFADEVEHGPADRLHEMTDNPTKEGNVEEVSVVMVKELGQRLEGGWSEDTGADGGSHPPSIRNSDKRKTSHAAQKPERNPQNRRIHSGNVKGSRKGFVFPRDIVNLVLLRQPVAESRKGIRSFRAVALTS